MSARVRVAAIGLLLLLGGCTGPGGPKTIVTEPGTLFADQAGGEATTGGILGVVVDEAIRPLPGSAITLDDDISRLAAEDGSFSFLDVATGTHRLRVAADGFAEQGLEVSVAAGEISQVRILLQAIPPMQATWVTQKFDGFAQVTNAGTYGTILALLHERATGNNPCGQCTFRFQAEAGLNSSVVEASMTPNDLPGGSNGFAFMLESATGAVHASFSEPNPMNARLMDLDENATSFTLDLYPGSDPIPELNKQFQVIVTLFYHASAPENFTALA